MARSPLISTLIPTYRRPQLLGRAIQSALNQTFADVQVLVFDNHSCDETEAVVHGLTAKDPRVQFVGSEVALTAVENFQRALHHVDTPYFSILADDDYLLPEFYKDALNALYRYPNSGFFMGATLDVDEQGQTIHDSAAHWPQGDYFTPPGGVYEILRHYVNWTGSLFRKELAERFPLNPAVKAIDFDFVLRAALHHPFSFSRQVCAHFVQHKHSYSTSCGVKLVWPGALTTLETLMADPVVPASARKKIETLMHTHLKTRLWRIALRALVNGQFSEVEQIRGIFRTTWNHKVLCWGLSVGLWCGKSKMLLNAMQWGYAYLVRRKRAAPIPPEHEPIV